MALRDDGNTLFAGALDEDCMATGVSPSTKCEDDSKADTSAGAGYVFVRSGTNWTQQAFLGTMWLQLAYVKGANTEAFNEFGSSVALSRDGRTMAVGARGDDSTAKGINGNSNDNSAAEAGSAYVFALSSETQIR